MGLRPGRQRIALDDFIAMTRGAGMKLEILPEVREALLISRAVVDRFAMGDAPVYGLNTGLGGNLGHRLTPEEIGPWQQDIIDGRAVAIGDALPSHTGRAILLYRIHSAALGRSGLSPVLFDYLVAAFEAGISPEVPDTGSIGAGDLAQNAVWARGLLGQGTVYVGSERHADGAAGLAAAKLEPPQLAARDGMALINHSGLTVARAADALCAARHNFGVGRRVAALSCEGYGANRQVFSTEADSLRPAPGQALAAGWFAEVLAGAETAPRRVQEALCFRTLAPVTGAAFHALDHAVSTWENEANGTSDSPVVTDDGTMISTANFHTPGLALALEAVSLAAAMLAHGSVQRLQKLCDPALSGLPRYLSPVGGGSAGFVPAQKLAVALLARIRHGALPMAFDPVPVSDTVEDMAPQTPVVAGKLSGQMADLRRLFAIEALAAAQALDLRAPVSRSKAGEALHAAIRARVPRLRTDRPMGPDIVAVAEVLDTLA